MIIKKQFTASVLCVFWLTAALGQQKFTIKGKISGMDKEARVMLSYIDGEKRKLDSTIARKGTFSFTGTVAEAVKASIEMRSLEPDNGPMTIEKYEARDVQDFFLENTKIEITGNNIKTAEIRGGAAQADYLLLKSQLKPLQDKMKPLSEQMREYTRQKNDKARDELFPKLRAIREEMTKTELDFIQAHGNSYVSLDLLQQRSSIIDPVTFEPLFNGLSDKMKSTRTGQKLIARLNLAQKLSVGKPAIAFTQNTTEDKPFSLSSLKGKYVLVDFWASWCGPCRAENPNVVKAYHRFKDKNFEIVGVSLDDKKAPWLQAIEKDGLPWIHVSDLKGWKNDVAVAYGVNAVPQNFLLNPEGIIIAKNLRGEDLSKKLAGLIPSPTQNGVQFSHGTWKETLAKAKAENKLIFIDVYTSWCGPCKKMAKEIFPLKKVGDKFNAAFINYKIDAEKGEGKEIAKTYGVNAYPTYLFVDGNGTLYYRSLGSMPEEQFIQEADHAQTEFRDPRPLTVWESEYPAKKNDKDFLYGYLRKISLQKVGNTQLKSEEVLDQFVSLASKDELLKKDVLKFLLSFVSAHVDGPFYSFITKNRIEVEKLLGYFPTSTLIRYISGDIKRAIAKKDVQLLEQLATARRALPSDVPIDWEADALRMNFYTQTSNQKELIKVLTRYIKSVESYDKNKIKAANEKNLKQYNDKLANSTDREISPEQIEKDRKFYGAKESISYAYRIRSIAEAALKAVDDKKILNEALGWMKLAGAYSDNFTIPEVTAGILHKLGRTKEAIEYQQRSIAALNASGLDNEIIKTRLNTNLSKIKEGKPTWVESPNPNVVTSNK